MLTFKPQKSYLLVWRGRQTITQHPGPANKEERGSGRRVKPAEVITQVSKAGGYRWGSLQFSNSEHTCQVL